MSWLQTLAEALPGIAIVVGLIYGFGRWSSKIDANTKATENLTDAFDKEAKTVSTSLMAHEVRLENHETRLNVVEKEVTNLKYKH